MFDSFSALEYVTMAQVRRVGENAFRNCTKLQLCYFAQCREIKKNCFNRAGLETLIVPKCQMIHTERFSDKVAPNLGVLMMPDCKKWYDYEYSFSVFRNRNDSFECNHFRGWKKGTLITNHPNGYRPFDTGMSPTYQIGHTFMMSYGSDFNAVGVEEYLQGYDDRMSSASNRDAIKNLAKDVQKDLLVALLICKKNPLKTCVFPTHNRLLEVQNLDVSLTEKAMMYHYILSYRYHSDCDIERMHDYLSKHCPNMPLTLFQDLLVDVLERHSIKKVNPLKVSSGKIKSR